MVLFSVVFLLLAAMFTNAATLTFNKPTASESMVGTYTFNVTLVLNTTDTFNASKIRLTTGATEICNITSGANYTNGTTTTKTCNYDTLTLPNGAKTFTATMYYGNGTVSPITGTVSANVLNPTADNTACQNTRSTIYVALGLVALFAIVGAAYGLINIFSGSGEMASFSILAISIIALGVVVLVGYILMSAVSSAVCTVV